MAKTGPRVDVQLGSNGRVVIPSELRRTLGLKSGDTLVARVEEDRLILEKPESVKRRLRVRYASVAGGKSLAAELIHERRDEARAEAKG